MEKSGMKDMTEGKPLKLILGFGIPLLLGMLFQQVYSMMDTIIVGRFLGVDALAAVGSTGSINFMIIGFCMGVCNGFAIPVAQCFGAGDYKALRKYVANGTWLSIAFAFLMTFVVCIFCRQIMTWMKTPENIFEDANTYIFIIFLGIPATFLYNVTSGIIRSLGDSKSPLVFLVCSSIINIVFDLIAICVLDAGVAGAAWATVISQLLAGVACLIYMKKKFEILKLSRDDWRVRENYMVKLCGIGVPMGLQYSITAIGSVVLQAAVNGLGFVAVAAMTAGSRAGCFFCCPFDAMGSTMATYAGQNIGARKLERVSSGLVSCSILGLIYAIIACLVLVFAGREISALFVDMADPQAAQIVEQSWQYLVWNSVFYFPLALVNIVRFTIQGMGFSGFAVIAGICEMIARAAVGGILVPILGYVAACVASPAAWIAADLFLIPAFLHVSRVLKRRFV